MPHFASETFISQYFWLVFTFILFYYVVNTSFIPSVAKTLKIRKVFTSEETTEIKSDERDLVLNQALKPVTFKNKSNLQVKF